MRPLTDEEMKQVFGKLVKYIGENTSLLINRSDDTYCFRLHKNRVYYCSEKLMKKAASISRENLISFGSCFGKFTSSQKFRLTITALDYLAPYAKVSLFL